jgi:type VI secretion system protein ImpC
MSAAETPQADQTGKTEVAAARLLEEMIKSTLPKDEREAERTKMYFRRFLAQVVEPGQVVSNNVEANIKHWIGEIDKRLSAQLNEVMHHPDFQKLEGTWRGLHYLVHLSETGENLQIRVLNVTQKELFEDQERAVEFDQSALFKMIYEEVYGQLGGIPYSMLVGDYQFGRHPQDISLLKMISNVAACAYVPFIAAASPLMFNMDRFDALPRPRDLAKIFDSVEYASWKAFRESEDSCFVGLTLPRVLCRLPYGAKFTAANEFNFAETVDGSDHDKYAWMSAAWAYAVRVTDAFAKWGWMIRTRGVEGGGKVEGLPAHVFYTDDGDIAMKCPTEIAMSDSREFEFSNLGFLSLLHNKETDDTVFMSAQSCQLPQTYFDPAANANAELAAKLNLLLCTSRFAHYLKVMARDKRGAFMEPKAYRKWLNEWIRNYCVDPSEASGTGRAERPLSDALINVRPVDGGKPGWFEAVAYLRPHFQCETLTTSMRLVVGL